VQKFMNDVPTIQQHPAQSGWSADAAEMYADHEQNHEQRPGARKVRDGIAGMPADPGFGARRCRAEGAKAAPACTHDAGTDPTSSEVPERESRPLGVLDRDSGAMSRTSSSREPWMNSISSCRVATCSTGSGQQDVQSVYAAHTRRVMQEGPWTRRLWSSGAAHAAALEAA
jgi:hypothetical protein